MSKCKRCKTANSEPHGYCKDCYIISLGLQIKLGEKLIEQYGREMEITKNALDKLKDKIRLLTWKRNLDAKKGG